MKQQSNLKKAALVLSMTMAVAACKTNKQAAKDEAAARDAGYASGYSTGQSDAQANAIKAGAVLSSLYETYPAAIYDFALVKFGKDNANYAVISYTIAGVTNYLAINVANFTAGANFGAYITTHPNEVFIQLTANGDGTYSCAAGCVNGLGAATSSSLVFEKTAGSMKDLDKAAAAMESFKAESLAAGIASEFGLSEERSLKIAKLASSWEKLAKTRALTNADADAFAEELAGVDFAQIDHAVKRMADGSNVELNNVLEKAAEVNGTTSENMASIMMKLFF